MRRIFISYAREDLPIVGAIRADLEAIGHSVFVDQGLIGGQQWWDMLLAEIENSDAFVPVLSADYRASVPCRREAEWADELGIPLLPIDVGAPPSARYSEAIGKINWVRYDPSDRKSLGLLYRAVDLLGPVAPPAIRPTEPEIPITYLQRLSSEIEGDDEIPRTRQILIVAELKGKLNNRGEDQDARDLLQVLHDRVDVVYQVRTEIEDLLQVAPPVQPPQAPPRAKPPAAAKTKTAPPPPRPDREAGRAGRVLIILGAVLVLAGIGAGIAGIAAAYRDPNHPVVHSTVVTVIAFLVAGAVGAVLLVIGLAVRFRARRSQRLRR